MHNLNDWGSNRSRDVSGHFGPPAELVNFASIPSVLVPASANQQALDRAIELHRLGYIGFGHSSPPSVTQGHLTVSRPTAESMRGPGNVAAFEIDSMNFMVFGEGVSLVRSNDLAKFKEKIQSQTIRLNHYLPYAAALGRTKIVNFLLHAGANPCENDYEALRAAQSNHQKACVKAILDHPSTYPEGRLPKGGELRLLALKHIMNHAPFEPTEVIPQELSAMDVLMALTLVHDKAKKDIQMLLKHCLELKCLPKELQAQVLNYKFGHRFLGFAPETKRLDALFKLLSEEQDKLEPKTMVP